ncbi:MAG: hypothetical protein MUF81_13335 [Verrucomicrobia bacterium]|jgi:hypothetical protein|nr:hypothetical protein [Verrucomicrobiota bacterium]
MKATKQILTGLVLGCALALGLTLKTTKQGITNFTRWRIGIAILMGVLLSQSAFTQVNTNRNYVKFMNQAFSLIDTNAAALTDTNLYNALIAFPVLVQRECLFRG